MNKPIAVLISDIHFNLQTLELASSALWTALSKASMLDVPLIIAGDLNDTKAIIRGEVANKLIRIFSLLEGPKQFSPQILIGNHDRLNEKTEEHSLNFLRPYVRIVDSLNLDTSTKIAKLPYYDNIEKLKEDLKKIPKNYIVIMHQGLKEAYMGDYIKDSSAISLEDIKGYKAVFSGHYHRAQTIDNFTYIGSPFTHTFGEADDGAKGFLILYFDGSFEREVLNLRKHIILNRTLDNLYDPVTNMNKDDLIWLKVKGPKVDLYKLSKEEVGQKLFGHLNFKFDLYPIDTIKEIETADLKTDSEILDMLIEGVGNKAEELKKLWRELCK